LKHISLFTEEELNSITRIDTSDRHQYIGSSDLYRILRSDQDAENVRLEKRKEKETDDLTWNFKAQLGILSEVLHQKFFCHYTGLSVTKKDPVIDRQFKFIRVSPDGITSDGYAVEFKHRDSFFSLEQTIQDYEGQLQMICRVLDINKIWVSQISGNRYENKPNVQYAKIERNNTYIQNLLERLHYFWHDGVLGNKPVIDMHVPSAPIELVKKVDFTSADNPKQNEFLSAEEELKNAYDKHNDTKKLFEKKDKAVKKFIEKDVVEAKGKHFTYTRDKNNRITRRLNK
tara:strand:- start:1140 stop:2000 length:861 start_codon:yes stop_codon:yes gene_type:complete